MDLYALSKRRQARDHLLKGGIVQPEIQSVKIKRGTDAILLTKTDLANITKALSEEQRTIADRLQSLTTGVLAAYGNQASMRAYGYKKFTDPDYWPIRSAKEGLHSDIERGGGNTRSIQNIGLAKATVPNAGNPLDILGIFDTFSAHVADMTDYAAWLCPMEDVNRLYNFKFQDAEGNLTGRTIKGILDRVGGPGSQKYWHNLMEDIQNGIRTKTDSPLSDFAAKATRQCQGGSRGCELACYHSAADCVYTRCACHEPCRYDKGACQGCDEGKRLEKGASIRPDCGPEGHGRI